MPRPKKADEAKLTHLVDTNVLLRFLMQDEPDMARSSAALMARVDQGLERLVVPVEVVTETVWTLERVYKVPRRVIADQVLGILTLRGVEVPGPPLALSALDLYGRHNVDFVDCLLTVRARVHGVPVYTYDKTDFKKLPVDWESP